MKIKLHFVLLLLAVCSMRCFADDYKEYAKQVRENIWNWEDSAFKNYTVPDEYAHESAVILADKNELIASGNSKLRAHFILSGRISKELQYANTYRRMIQLNDKAAVDEYSNISYKEQKTNYGYLIKNKFKTIVGVRIIKADGSINEVDMEEAVSVTEGKKDKESHKKLAVPGLEVGDILDYFFCYEGVIDSEDIPPMDFMFADKYPMLSYAVYCELGKKMTVEFRSVNGAPDFKVSNDKENGNVILEASATNLPKIRATNWVSVYREMPMIRLAVYYNDLATIFRPASARKPGVHKDVPIEDIFTDSQAYLALSGIYPNEANVLKIRSLIKKYKKKHPKASSEDIAKFTYDALYFYWPDNLSSLRFACTLRAFLEVVGKVECRVGQVTSRFDARKEEVCNASDIYYFVSVNNDNLILTYPQLLSMPGEINPYYEGEEALSIEVKKYAPAHKIPIQGKQHTFTMPVSTAEQNRTYSKLNVKFDENMQSLHIECEFTAKGHMKGSYKKELTTIADYDSIMRKRLYTKEKSRIEEMQKNKRDEKYVENLVANMQKGLERQRNAIKQEVENYHNIKAKNDTVDYPILSHGLTAENPDFEMKMQYDIEGLVKKAGRNYVLDAGKLLGNQLEIKDNDRQRTENVYMSFARRIDREVRVAIPEGYLVEGVESLNMQVDNEYTSYISSAKIEEGVLVINASKVYKQNFVPATAWDKILEITDASNDINAKSVVLKPN